MRIQTQSEVFFLLVCVSIAYAVPSIVDYHKHNQVIPAFKQSHDTQNGYTKSFLLSKMNEQFDQIIQEMVQADQHHEEYKVNIQEEDLHSMDIDKQLKSFLLSRMAQMYEEAMENHIPGRAQDHVHQQQVSVNIQVKDEGQLTERGGLMDQFLYHKINEIQRQRYDSEEFKPHFERYDNDAAISEHMVQIMSDENAYKPIFRFDGAADDYCYPDWPSSQNDGRCLTNFNNTAPVFFEVCLLYTSPSPRDATLSRMPSSA